MKTNRGHNEMEKTMHNKKNIKSGKNESYAVITGMKDKKRRK